MVFAVLIHSVTPPHLLTEEGQYPEMTLKPFEGGYLEGFDTPGGFKIARLCSTDLSLYLKSEYDPGRPLEAAPTSSVTLHPQTRREAQ